MAPQTFNSFLQNVSVFAALVLLVTVSGESTELPEERQSVTHTATLDNSTLTQDNHEMPKVLRMQRSCRSEHNDFCVTGVCHYTPDVDTPSCSCPSTHVGERCEHLQLPTGDKPSQSSPEEIIGICLGVTLMLGCIAGVTYCCVKKRCKRETLPYKTYNGKEDV